ACCESELRSMASAGLVRRSKSQKAQNYSELPFAVSKHWAWVTLGQICALENGDRGRNYPNKSAQVVEGVPFINAGHLMGGLVDQDQMSYISEDRYKSLGSGKFTEGDILFCLRGSLGKCAIVTGLERG